MVIDSIGENKCRTKIVRHILMSKEIGDNVAKFALDGKDGYIKLGICELEKPIGVGAKTKKDDVVKLNPHTVLAFDNVKSVDIWIRWLKHIKKELVKKEKCEHCEVMQNEPQRD